MDIGLNAWEEVNILTKGSNYGYAEREGTEQLFVGGTNDGKTGGQTVPPTPFPDPDSLTVTGIATRSRPCTQPLSTAMKMAMPSAAALFTAVR